MCAHLVQLGCFLIVERRTSDNKSGHEGADKYGIWFHLRPSVCFARKAPLDASEVRDIKAQRLTPVNQVFYQAKKEKATKQEMER